MQVPPARSRSDASSIDSIEDAKVQLESALAAVDSSVAAGRALMQIAARYRPAASTSKDAFRHMAEQALRPHFGDDEAAKAVTWNLLDLKTFRESALRPDERSSTGLGELRRCRWVDVGDLYDAESLAGPIPWDLYPYTARGLISLCAAYPKVGKSTFAGIYAHAKAVGGSFLDRILQAGCVLYVAPDESLHAVRRRFQALGTPRGLVTVATASKPSMQEIVALAVDFDLVIVDTLLRVADAIDDETDNAAWVRWFERHDAGIRDSNAAWLFVHHTRKSGGSGGLGIRGASSILGCVDIAFSLRKFDGDQRDGRRRLIRMEGTRLDDADDLLIEIEAETERYRAIGDAKVHAILNDGTIQLARKVLKQANGPLTATEVNERLVIAGVELSRPATYPVLEKLVDTGLASRSGQGGKSDPYKFEYVRPSGALGAPGRTDETLSDGPAPTSDEPDTHLHVVQ